MVYPISYDVLDFHRNMMRSFSIIKRIPAFVVKSNILTPTVHSAIKRSDQTHGQHKVTSLKSRVLEKPENTNNLEKGTGNQHNNMGCE